MFRSYRSIVISIAAFLFVIVGQSTSVAGYSVIDLGTFNAASVNNHGQVVGNGPNGMLWSGGMLINLAPFIDPVEPSTGLAYDINDSERIVASAAYDIAGPCINAQSRVVAIDKGVLFCKAVPHF